MGSSNGPARAKRLRKRAFVEIVEFATHRKAVCQLAETDLEILPAVQPDNERSSALPEWRSWRGRPPRSRQRKRASRAGRWRDPPGRRRRAPTIVRQAHDIGRGTTAIDPGPKDPQPLPQRTASSRRGADRGRSNRDRTCRHCRKASRWKVFRKRSAAPRAAAEARSRAFHQVQYRPPRRTRAEARQTRQRLR